MANIKLTAKEDQFVKAMDRAAGSVGRLSAMMNVNLQRSFRESDAITQQFSKGIGRVGASLETVGRSLTTSLTVPITLMAGVAAKAYGDIDQLKRGLDAYGISLDEIKKTAKLPGLGIEEAAKSTITFASVKFNAETSAKAVREFGNALIYSGRGKEELTGIATAFAQMKGKGNVMAQEINQIAERLPMIRDLMMQAFGTSDTEVLQKRNISADNFLEQIVKQMEKLPRVAGGFKVGFENVVDSLKLGSYEIVSVADKLFNLSERLNSLSGIIDQAVLAFKGLSPEMQKLIFGTIGLTAVLGPLSVAVGVAIKSYGALIAGSGALIASITGIVAVVGGAIALWVDYAATQNRISNATKSLADVETEARKSIHEQALAIQNQTDVLNNSKSSLEDRKKAVRALIDISPEYFGKLDGEKLKYEDLNVAVSKYITNLENAAKANLIQAEIDKKIKTAAEIRLNPNSATSTAQVIGMKLSYVMTGSNPEDLLKYGNLMKLNAEVAAGKIEEGIKPLKEELDKLAQLGFKPKVVVTPPKSNSIGTGNLIGEKIDVQKEIDEILKEWQARKDILGKVIVKQIDQYAGDTVDEVKAKGLEIYRKGVQAAFQTAAETDFMVSQNTPFPIHKLISFSDRDIMASMNYLNEKVKQLPNKIQFLPGMSELNAESERFKADLAAMQEKLIMDLGTNFTVGIGEALGEAIMGKGFNIGHVFQNMFNIIGDYMIKLGRESIAMQTLVKRLQETMFNPAGIGISAAIAVMAGGGLLKGLAGSLFNNTPKFANGGIVYGPTMGLMGEYAGARTNPEVIAPLSKLKDMIGGGSGAVIPDVKILGEDIYISFNRYKKRTGQA